MTYSLTGQRVLIVGACSDIAAALAADLLQERTRVTITGRDIEKTAVAAKVIGDAVWPIALDLSDEEPIQAAADQVRAAGGLRRGAGQWPGRLRRCQGHRPDPSGQALRPIDRREGLAAVLLRPGRVAAVAGRRCDGGHQRQREHACVRPAGELAPPRVSAISPAVIAAHRLGRHGTWQAAAVPARRSTASARHVQDPPTSQPPPALTSRFITGETLRVDRGARWA